MCHVQNFSKSQHGKILLSEAAAVLDSPTAAAVAAMIFVCGKVPMFKKFSKVKHGKSVGKFLVKFSLSP